MNQKIALITGANGMDSKTLTHILLSKGYHVILTYRRNSLFGEHEILPLYINDLAANPNSKLTFEVCDITDKSSVEFCIKETIRKYGQINELYMLAAMSHVGNSFNMKEYSILANGMSYYYFLEVIKTYSKQTKVYGALTSELAGNVPDGTTFNEETAWHPRSPYSLGKSLGGHWIKFYRESLDAGLFCCFGILFNHSNTYRTKDFFIRKVTDAASKIAIGQQTELKLGNLNWWRDEHWSDFGCEAMWKMLQRDTPTDYVIGNGETHHAEEYLDIAFKFFNLDWHKYVKFDQSLTRPNEVPRLISDPSKAERELGWIRNRIPFKEHVEMLCQYDFALNRFGTYNRPVVL